VLPGLRAGLEQDLKGGEFFGPDGLFELWGNAVQVTPNSLSQDREIAEKLWEVSERLTGVKFEFGKKANSAGK
jgi:hypothetical protein